MSDGSQPTALSPHRKAHLAASALLQSACTRLERARTEMMFSPDAEALTIVTQVRGAEDDLRHFHQLHAELSELQPAVAIPRPIKLPEMS